MSWMFSIVVVTAKKTLHSRIPMQTQGAKRRRWSDDERHLLLSTFADDLANKTMPSAKRISEIAHSLPLRTIPQIRAQLSNYICGKIRVD